MYDLFNIDVNQPIYCNDSYAFGRILPGPCFLREKAKKRITINVVQSYDLRDAYHDLNHDSIFFRMKYLLEEVIGDITVQQAYCPSHLSDILNNYKNNSICFIDECVEHYTSYFSYQYQLSNFFILRPPQYIYFRYGHRELNVNTKFKWKPSHNHTVVFKHIPTERIKAHHTKHDFYNTFTQHNKLLLDSDWLYFNDPKYKVVDYDTPIEEVMDLVKTCKSIITYMGGAAFFGFYFKIPTIIIGGTKERHKERYFWATHYQNLTEFINARDN